MELNFAAICAQVESLVPDREAIVWRDRAWTWRELGDRTRRLAGALVAAGYGVSKSLADVERWESPHDHVALYLHNGNEYLEGMLGAYAARCAPVNVNYRYRAAELRHVLADSRTRVVIFHGAFAATLDEVRGDLPDLDVLVQVDDDSEAPLLDGAVRYEDWLASSSPHLPGELVSSWSGDDLYVCYTGGTTGSPKGVLWRQEDFLASALGLRGVDPDAVRGSRLRALPAPPLMHGAAHWNAMSCWAAGGTVVLQDDTTRLDPADVWRSVARHGATSLLIVGDPFARPLLDEWDRAAAAGHPYAVPSLRHLLSGGAVLSDGVLTLLHERLPAVTVVDVLGSTESGRQGIAQSRPADTPDPDGSGGRAARGGFATESTAVVLADDLASRLAPGDDRVGWLAQTGRVPRGYLGDPAKSAATFPVVDRVPMSIAGDRARLRPDGSIGLLGRDSATINTGGEKVFAEEVETVLKSHPAVFDAVVCGRPSERWGQEVVAVVQLRPGGAADDDELRAWCRRELADFKAPKAVVRVERVQRSPSGKADYRWAANVAADAAARDAQDPAG